MAAINPISGGMRSIQRPTPQMGTPADQTDKADFGKTLTKLVGSVDDQQQQAQGAVENLLSGRSDNVLPVVTAVAKADMSFKLLMGVRNKVIEAYKQTMNMQV
ncbi:MAG: flagellar hook-basal body complex protein FliE [Planctomycetota bacterium]